MSLTNPLSLQIINAVKSRAEAITFANGYSFEPQVYLGAHDIAAEDLEIAPAINVYDIGDDPADPESFAHDHMIRLEVIVEAHIRRELTDDTMILHQLIASIRKAVFLEDTTLGGLALDVLQGSRRVKYPESGDRHLAVQQQVLVMYLETYGNP